MLKNASSTSACVVGLLDWFDSAGRGGEVDLLGALKRILLSAAACEKVVGAATGAGWRRADGEL